MFPKTCEYAIRAMIFIAQKSSATVKVGVKEIAREIHAPEHFIAKILQELSKKRLVQSMKGPTGGFFLDEDGLKTSIADIVRALDGEGIFVDCALGLKECNEKKPCPVHHQFKDIRHNMIGMMEHNTIGNFKEKLESGEYFLKNS